MKLKRHLAKMVKTKKGFALIELVIVIAVMGVLGTVTIPSLTTYVNKSKRTVAEDIALKVHNAAHMIKALDKVELGTVGVNGNISPQGIPWRVELVSGNSNRYSEKYTNLLKNYVQLSDNHLENIELRGPGGPDSQAIRVYYKFNNGNNRIYITDSNNQKRIDYQERIDRKWKTIDTTHHKRK